MTATTTAYIGLGSNMGNPVQQIYAAMEALERLPHARLMARSRLYHSPPVGYREQPDFINAVVRLQTSLTAENLLDHLLQLEQGQGRVRQFANGPRTLDLDMLLYGNLVQQTSRLTLPHPRLAQRSFVLLPWLEVAPDSLPLPGVGTLGALAHQCPPPHAIPLDFP